MNIDEFVDKAKGDLELFRQEFKKLYPERNGQAPPIAPEVIEAMEVGGVQNPEEMLDEEDRFWSEFSGWRGVDPDDPDGSNTKPPVF